jgi:hypothetical protein
MSVFQGSAQTNNRISGVTAKTSSKVQSETELASLTDIEETPEDLVSAAKFETWEQEPAIKYILFPMGFSLCLWTLIASIWSAGEVNGKGDLGLAFLATNWMFFHIAIALFAFPALMISGCKWTQMPWLSGMLSCCYTLHQFEEHAWDIFGRRFSFVYMVLGNLFCPDATSITGTTMSVNADDVFLKTTGCGRINE